MFLLLNLVSLFLCVPSVLFCFVFFQILCIRKISLPFILYGLLHREEDRHQSVWLEILLKPFGDGGSRRAWWRRDVTCLRLVIYGSGRFATFFQGLLIAWALWCLPAGQYCSSFMLQQEATPLCSHWLPGIQSTSSSL